MRRLFVTALAVIVALLAFSACNVGRQSASDESTSAETEETDGNGEEDKEMADEIYITVNGYKITVKLEKNAAAEALAGKLKNGDITYTASNYGGFEKVGSPGFSLPQSDTPMTTEAGDVVLYSGDQIVLFYGSNSWSYTKLGKMHGYSAQELKDILTAADPAEVRMGLR